MDNYITVTNPGVSIATGTTAVATPLPLDSSGKLPMVIRVAATVATYVCLTTPSKTAAVAGDMMVQPGDAVILNCAGFSGISAILPSGTGVLEVSPIENGGIGSTNPSLLDLNFRTTTTLDPRVTFARADTVAAATAFDSTGRMVTYGVNKLLYSSTFDNAAWSKTDVTATLSSASPFDNAYLMTEGSAGTAVTYQNVTTTANTTITVSFVLKRGNTDWVRLGADETVGTNSIRGWFNLATGAKGSTQASGAGSATGSTITSLGGGWYRCTLTGIVDTTSTTLRGLFLAASADLSTTRVSGSTYYVSASQLEQSSTPNAYSPTQGTSTSGPRFDYDPATPAGTTGGELAPSTASTAGWSSTGVWSSTFSNSGANLRVIASGTSSGWSSADYTLTGLSTGKTYTVSGAALAAVSGWTTFSQGILQVLNGATLLASASLAAPGTFATFNFVATATSLTLRFRNEGTPNGSASYCDFGGALSILEVTFTPRGLLIEESRTNLLLQSRDMTNAAWTKTDVTPARTQVGIDGVANSACLMTEGTLGTAATRQTSAAITAGSTITASFVVKRGNTDIIQLIAADSTGAKGGNAWFNLATGAKLSVVSWGGGTGFTSAITPLGGGWYRCAVTAIPDGVYTQGMAWIASANADLSNTRVSGATYIVDAAQLEVGAFATSIIPTGAATVTRAADNASMTGTNFSSWYSQVNGTFVSEFFTNDTSSGVGARGVISVNDTTANNKYDIRSIGANTVGAVAGVAQWNIAVGSSSGGVTHKMSVAYATNDIAAYRDATQLGTDNVASIPTVTSLQLGGLDNLTQYQLNGYIRRITYYNTRLPNATLQSLTT